MINDLKPYPAYKDSGVPWLGEVPEHWEVKRNKLFLREVNERSEDGSEELLTISQYTGVTRRRDRLSKEGELLTNAASLVGYKRVSPGDIVMNIMLAWNGSLGVSPFEGIASPAYCVYRIKTDIEPRFFHYLLRTPLFTGVFKTVSTGVVDSRLRLYPEVFFRLPSLLPPKAEQSAIIRYLDHIDRRIRRYIRSKQKLIKLLEEQKQAIIHQAVTRGLNPDVKLKPSGVEWLGEIPEYWNLLRLKDTVFQIVDTEHKTAPFYENGNYFVVRTSNVKQGELLFSDAKYTDEAGFQEWTRRGKPKPGDILFTREAPAGEACLVPKDVPLCLGQRMVLFRVNTELLNSQFGLYSIYGGVASEFIRQLSLGSTVPHFNMFDIACIPMLLPPIGEQQTIANFLNLESKKLSETIDRAHREITLLKEYRTRLIADMVTGKLDVREASANLPEETDETEVLDVELNGDEETTEEDIDCEPEE